jgi:hypothetical protein
MRSTEVGTEAPTEGEQEWIESFGKVNGMEDGEFDIDGLLAKGVTVEEDTQVDKGSSKFGPGDAEGVF